MVLVKIRQKAESKLRKIHFTRDIEENYMDIVTNIIWLFAGCGVFIAGMNMLSDGLEKSAGNKMKTWLGKISGSRLAGISIGAGVTAVIQSSAATTVMAIGFVNAGIMTLFQATAIIMGANIGTTVTGLLVSLGSLDFDVGLYAMAFAFIGVMMTFIKNDKVKNIGGMLCGLGIIFVGLEFMGSAFNNEEIKAFVQKIFENISFPLLLIVAGALFTALIQSSSAATGVFITMVGTGALTMDNALFLVLGSNIGTCITAALAAMGASVNAQRTALIHLLFNLIGSLIFTIFIWIFRSQAVAILGGFGLTYEMQLAVFHIVFNVVTTLILVPFIKQIVYIATKIIPDKKKPESEELKLKYVDDRLLKTPHIALMQVKSEISYMASLAKDNIESSFVAMSGNGAPELGLEISERERIVDFTNHSLAKYLVKLSGLVSQADEQVIGTYFHVINDLERIGDHAENFYEITVKMKREGLRFSDEAVKEIMEMYDKVFHMFEIALEAFDNNDSSHLQQLTAIENEVDRLKSFLSSQHFLRMAAGNCTIEHSPYFYSTIVGLERVADHLE